MSILFQPEVPLLSLSPTLLLVSLSLSLSFSLFLSQALGGNARTCVISTVSPCKYSYEETVSTLAFAKR